MELLGNFWWWTASWQHGLSRGLGFCSYRPLFIPRCQSLYGNQLVNPSRSFLPLLPPSLPPRFRSVSSLTVWGQFSSYWRKTKPTQATGRGAHEAGGGCGEVGLRHPTRALGSAPAPRLTAGSSSAAPAGPQALPKREGLWKPCQGALRGEKTYYFERELELLLYWA